MLWRRANKYGWITPRRCFDASESDTIRKHEYNEELLNELYFRIEDESEKEKQTTSETMEKINDEKRTETWNDF